VSEGFTSNTVTDFTTPLEIWQWCYKQVPTEAGGNLERTVQHRIADAEVLFDHVAGKFLSETK
jgi:hypothetical protein